MDLINQLTVDQRLIIVITIGMGILISFVLGSYQVKPAARKPKHEGKPRAISSEEWRSFKLIEVEHVSHDTRRFRFALPSPDHVLGLPIGQHISLKFVDADGKENQRSYTPVSSDDDLGFVDFVIKVYFKQVHPRFPDGGKMSQHLNSLKIGDSILMKGPKGHLEYQDDHPNGDSNGGIFVICKPRKEVREIKVLHLGMIAGGTGITPMLQIIRAIIKNNSKDNIHMSLIYANQTEADILLRKEIDELVSQYGNSNSNDRKHLSKRCTFTCYYTLDRPATDGSWKYGTGFVDTAMCREHLPKSSDRNSMVFMCGPQPMIERACVPSLQELGWKDDQYYAF